MKKLLPFVFLLLGITAQAQVTRVWIRQGTTKPASCTNKTVLFHLTVADGSNPAGIYRCNGSAFVATGGGVTSPMLGGNGTAAAPTYSFSGEPDTGMFLSAANAIGFSTAGTERWVINSSGALNPIASNTYDIGGSTTIRDIGIGRQAVFSGSTSGTTTLKATAIAGSTTLTLPAATDTLVALDATQTLSNKSFSNNVKISTDTTPTTTAGVGALSLCQATGLNCVNWGRDSGTGRFPMKFSQSGVGALEIDGGSLVLKSSALEFDADDSSPIGTTLKRSSVVYAVKFCYAANVCDFAGSGDPDGVVAAGIGSTYRDTGTGNFYQKMAGGTGTSGWTVNAP